MTVPPAGPPVVPRLRVVLVTGLSGGGKLSVLGALEDLGFETVDNPPLEMLAEMVGNSERELAVGVDARTRGFDATRVLETLAALRTNPMLRLELVYVYADTEIRKAIAFPDAWRATITAIEKLAPTTS